VYIDINTRAIMKMSDWSAYDRYVILSSDSRNALKATYLEFMYFKDVKEALNQMANTTGNSYAFKGKMYKMRCTSSEASMAYTKMQLGVYSPILSIVMSQLRYGGV
jgi:hypothetical protein